MFKIDDEVAFRGLFEKYKKFDTNKEPLTYVHTIKFHPSVEETRNMIERNSSVDTFQAGDTYVEDGLKLDPADTRVTLEPGDDGWADRLHDFIQGEYNGEIVPSLTDIDRYAAGKGILVGHSMGGLVAREFVTNSKYSDENAKIKEIVTIGAPHTGCFITNAAKAIHSTRAISMFACGMAGIFAPINGSIADFAGNKQYIDIKGDAIRDMNVGSEFLETLNYDRDQRIGEIDYSLIASYVGRLDFSDGAHAQLLVGGDNEMLGGDGVVSLRSQLARDPRDVSQCLLIGADEKVIYALHGESRHVASMPLENGEPAPLLKMICGRPELEVLPYYDVNYDQEWIPLYTTIKGEYFPYQCVLTTSTKDEFGGYLTVLDDLDVKERIVPDDLWDNELDRPVVASVLEEIETHAADNSVTEVKHALKNIVNESAEIRTVIVEGINRGILSRGRLILREPGDSVNDDVENTFWSSILSSPVTAGLPEYMRDDDNVWGPITFSRSGNYPSMDPMVLKHFYSSYREDTGGHLRGALLRGYISFDTDLIPDDTKNLIQEHSDTVKVILGYHGCLYNSLFRQRSERVLIKRASFGASIGTHAWGSGSKVIATYSFGNDTAFLLNSENPQMVLEFQEVEIDLTDITFDGKMQVEICFENEGMPALQDIIVNEDERIREGHDAFYATLKHRGGFRESSFAPYLKICY
ncbi:MAG: hypothetical protein JW938_00665 [Candidatus Omnitrophica bacterium]|nr:hypothetical protein [Candidatus Omnitrophota bacterium]